MAERPTLDALLVKTLDLVTTLQVPSLLIGGLAVGVVGEARLTQDVDLILALPIRKLRMFTQRATEAGFFISRVALEEAPVTGAVRLTWRGLHLDVIFASTAFERSAFARKLTVTLMGRWVSVPTPEDLILLKLIPGRDKDLLDAKTIVVRHRGRLDVRYLEQWAQRLSDEAEDVRIWQNVQRVLQETNSSESS